MRETRNTDGERLELVESRSISGYALVFDTDSTGIRSFVERIEPTALDGVIEKSDVLCLLNHNIDKGVLARSNKGEGSLSLVVDQKGLRYSFDAPNTALGDELLESVRRGDITASSFAFTVSRDTWQRLADGTYQRTINAIGELYDVSPVYRAAYDATSIQVNSRGLDELKARERAELAEYYEALRIGIN